MPYQLPRILADQYKTSLKTIYNYLSKYPSQIRTKKEFWKKFVNVEDFEKYFTKDLQNIQSVAIQRSIAKGFWSDFEVIEVAGSKDFQNFKSASKQEAYSSANTQLSGELWNFEHGVQKLQNELQTLTNQKEGLQKYNLVLQEQVKEFSLLAIEERNEKKERIAKHDSLQKELQTKTETHALQRTKLAQRLYLFVGLCIALTVALFALLLPSLKIF